MTDLFKKVSALVDEQLELHRGETFDLELMCRWLGITERENRNEVAKKLNYEASKVKPILEKNNRVYRYIDNNFSYINIKRDTDIKILDISYPKDSCNNNFNLSYSKIFAKSVITVAGEKDNAKTAYCLNFVGENMNNHHCVYHTNEMSEPELFARLGNFKHFEWYKEDGTLKFTALERFENWHDVVRQFPDSYHVVDYLDPGENAYMIGTFIDKIRQNLKDGMAVIAIQKKQSSFTKRDGTIGRNFIDYGVGGQFSEHKARIVIHLHNKNELYVKSCKAWHTKNPTGKKYKFDLIDFGSRFANIKEITTDYTEEDFVYRGGD